jgi:hypothetical protein
MNSRSRAVRALLLTCAVALAFLPWSPALADLGSRADRVTGSTITIGKTVPVTAIGDDPDPVPMGALASRNPGRPAVNPSRYADWLLRLSLAVSGTSGVPSWTWTSVPLAGASTCLRTEH